MRLQTTPWNIGATAALNIKLNTNTKLKIGMEKGIYHEERKDLKKHKSNGEAMVAQSTNPSKTTPYDYSGEKDFFFSGVPLLIARFGVGNDEEMNWRSTKAAKRLAADEVDELTEHVIALLQWGFFLDNSSPPCELHGR
jgi:hypothetical protein